MRRVGTGPARPPGGGDGHWLPWGEWVGAEGLRDMYSVGDCICWCSVPALQKGFPSLPSFTALASEI